MTSMIQDMLKKGIIKPSTSPFSSLVILEKTKKGWRMAFLCGLPALKRHHRERPFFLFLQWMNS